MTRKQKEPTNMMDFMLVTLSDQDRETAEKIKPLSSSVAPSAQFIAQTREQLLAAIGGSARRAAA